MFGRLASSLFSSAVPKHTVLTSFAVVSGAAAAALFSTVNAQPAAAAAPAAPVLDGKDFVPLTVTKVNAINDNTSVLTLAVAPGCETLPVTSYIVAKADIAVTNAETGVTATETVARPYTPIHSAPGSETGVGELHLLVKQYPTGKMSKHLCGLRAGDSILVKGPMPKLKYVPGSFDTVSCVVGGTGLTPALQLAEAILYNKSDNNTKVNIVFANVSGKDILLKSHIDALAAKFPARVKVTYVLDNAEPGHKGPVGRVNADLLSKLIPPASPKHLAVACGPPGFMAAVSGSKAPDYSQGEVDGAFKQLGFGKDNVYKF